MIYSPIKNKGWYKHGTERDWNNLVKKLKNYYKKGLPTKSLLVVARDVFLHSDTGETIFDICVEIAGVCSTTFLEE